MNKRVIFLFILLSLFASLILFGLIQIKLKGSTLNIDDINLAIADNDVSKIKKLIKNTDLNGYSRDSQCDEAEGGYIACLSPLQTACIYGNYEIVKLLVQNGADVNYQDRFIKETPLISISNKFKSDKNDILIAKYLLEHGANKNVKDWVGKTALDYAKANENKELINLLK